MKYFVAVLAFAAIALAQESTTPTPANSQEVKNHSPLLMSRAAGIFRNPKCGKVLEVAYEKVKLQDYTGFPAQMWETEYVGGSRFRLKNGQAGLYLDIKGDAQSNAPVTVRKLHEGEPSQEWQLNDDKTITSSAGGYAITIMGSDCRSGKNIVISAKTGEENQKFIVQMGNQ